MPLVTLVGPTASGKTALGILLAKRFGGYVLSADSRQVYRGMDIGTGKATETEQRSVRHFGLDIADPRRRFTIVDWVRYARRIIETTPGIPFVVGGTGQYVRALVEGWTFPPAGTVKRRRQLEQLSLTALVKHLRRLDPESARVIDLRNPRRVIRAIEVAEATGESFVSQRTKTSVPYRVLQLGIRIPRADLYRRIDRRVDERMRAGMLAEVRKLHENGLSWQKLESFGLEYRFLARHLQSMVTKADAVEQLKFAIHAYARRQLTWFRKDHGINWIRTERDAEKLIHRFLQST